VVLPFELLTGLADLLYSAGTSGRLGVLDAAECVPTFNTDPHEIIGIIAGGQHAMTMAVEGAEDHKKLAEEDLKNIDLTNRYCCSTDCVSKC
jgi:N-acetylmuramic acid 6-phosphate (MurNAc-6-P) etherase